MDFINYAVDSNTPAELLPFVRAYAPHRPQPARRDLLETEYEMWETSGLLSVRGLVADCGYDYDEEIKRMRELVASDKEEGDS